MSLRQQLTLTLQLLPNNPEAPNPYLPRKATHDSRLANRDVLWWMKGLDSWQSLTSWTGLPAAV
jgi:hypothetical protein